MKESPIFIKSYEMLVWLLGRTGKFPRNQRFLHERDSYARIHPVIGEPHRG